MGKSCIYETLSFLYFWMFLWRVDKWLERDRDLSMCYTELISLFYVDSELREGLSFPYELHAFPQERLTLFCDSFQDSTLQISIESSERDENEKQKLYFQSNVEILVEFRNRKFNRAEPEWKKIQLICFETILIQCC